MCEGNGGDMKDLSDSGGFTLLEAVISLSILMVVMFSASNLLVYATKISTEISVKHEIFENARIALDVMDAKIKSATELSLYTEASGTLRRLAVYIPGISDPQNFEYYRDTGAKYHRLDFGNNELASYVADIKVSIDGDLMTILIITDDRISKDGKTTVIPYTLAKKISLKGKKIK